MARQGQTIDLVAPGFLGLNLERQGSILSPVYAVEALNAVIDSSGRLATRLGYSDQTGTAITGTPNVESLHEYVDNNGNVEMIVAWDGGIGNSIDDPEGNDISGAVTDADGRWWFQNFNDKVIGFQNTQKPIVYNGSGNFATVVESAGTAPTISRGIGLAAYGRVWGLDSDDQTIKYSALLDETDWSTAGGGGSIDMSNIWTDGTDTVQGIFAFNGALVVFGTRHVVFWVDGVGSALGLDPLNIYVADVIAGVGLVSQWTAQHVGETEMVFLSRTGVKSLARVIQERSNPVTDLSKNVRSAVLDSLSLETSDDDVRSIYHPDEGFYLLTFPTAGTTWCFDVDRQIRDDEGERIAIPTRWDLAPTSWASRRNGSLLLGLAGEVGQYETSMDGSNTFRFSYLSPWIDLGEDLANRIKILKRLGTIIFVQGATDIVLKYGFDFEGSLSFISRSVEGSSGAEWGVAQWGIDEWSGALSLRIIKAPGSRSGQYIQVGVEITAVPSPTAIQQVELFTKIGRFA